MAKTKKKEIEKSEPSRPQQDVLVIARKRRHIYLLEKLQQGKSLKPSEIKELDELQKAKNPEPPAGDSEGGLPPGVVSTKQILSLAVGKSLRTIGYWIAEGMPVRQDGTYHIATIVEWYTLRNVKKIDGRGAKTDTENILDQVRAEKGKIELEQLRGDLVNRRQVEDLQARKIMTLKSAMLTLPKRISIKLVGMDERQIFTELTQALTRMIRVFAGQKKNGGGQNECR